MSNSVTTVKVTFIEHSGTEHIVDAKVGSSLMQAAINNLVPGIEADCGGLCACATCHCHVDPDWVSKVSAKSQGESDLLQNAPSINAQSRLSCQIQVSAELEGIVIRLPASQY